MGTRATGNSRFVMTKSPPANGKIPVSQIDSFCGYTLYTAQKSYQTSLQAYIANINDVEELLTLYLGRFWSQDSWMKQINTWLPDLCLCCVPQGSVLLGSTWGFLGLSCFWSYMDDIQHCGLYLFADDTNVFVFISGKTVSDIATAHLKSKWHSITV